MRSALESERFKFYYPPVPAALARSRGIDILKHVRDGDNVSIAGDVVIRRMCDYAARLNVQVKENEELKKQGINPHGGFFMPKLP